MKGVRVVEDDERPKTPLLAVWCADNDSVDDVERSVCVGDDVVELTKLRWHQSANYLVEHSLYLAGALEQRGAVGPADRAERCIGIGPSFYPYVGEVVA